MVWCSASGSRRLARQLQRRHQFGQAPWDRLTEGPSISWRRCPRRECPDLALAGDLARARPKPEMYSPSFVLLVCPSRMRRRRATFLSCRKHDRKASVLLQCGQRQKPRRCKVPRSHQFAYIAVMGEQLSLPVESSVAGGEVVQDPGGYLNHVGIGRKKSRKTDTEASPLAHVGKTKPLSHLPPARVNSSLSIKTSHDHSSGFTFATDL